MLESISYYIQSISRWLLRCRYSRGFGIQSPSAYSFVRYVVNEHDPYYAYEQLDEEMKDRSKTFRKLGRLFFRLANYWQPQYVVMGDYDFAPYVYAGCQNTLVRMIDDYYFDEESAKALVIVDMEWLSDEDIKNEIFQHASDQLLLVITDIYKTQQTHRLWEEMVADDRSGVCYDLYLCGIIFFDKSKHKQFFKINF